MNFLMPLVEFMELFLMRSMS